MRRVVVSIASCLVALGLMTGGAYADGAGPTNQVQVQNTHDGEARVASRAKAVEDRGPTVAPDNEATAYASCTSCRTVAVAIQVVLAVGPASDSRPTNSAVAVNYECHFCATFAYANQVLLNTDSDVHLGPEAEQQLHDLRDQVDHVAASDEAFDQMSADLDGLTQQMAAVVQSEIDHAGATAHRDDERHVDQAA